ncbi:MAG: protein-L-isoaspartate(D-aspartate) O-methyltransferase [Pseudomonadota bacterium]
MSAPSVSGPDRMVADLARHAREVKDVLGRDHIDPRVVTAMLEVPRERFLRPRDRAIAWGDHPISIGCCQTISQPFVVAFMTDLLAVDENSKILEIGTGSGYQSAILAKLAGEVHSVEIVNELARQAKQTLRSFGFANLFLHQGDGRAGLAAKAPFDRIIATAAAVEVPPAWLDQLAPLGRLLTPVGRRQDVQQLLLIEKSASGRLSERATIPVAFVPLTGSA